MNFEENLLLIMASTRVLGSLSSEQYCTCKIYASFNSGKELSGCGKKIFKHTCTFYSGKFCQK